MDHPRRRLSPLTLDKAAIARDLSRPYAVVRRYPRARRTGLLVSTLAWIALAVTFVVACGGAATPTRSAGPTPRRVAVGQFHQFGVGSDACSLLSAADLSSLGVSGAGAVFGGPSASPPSYLCGWPIGGFGNELALTYTPNFPAARSYVGYAFTDPPVAVPGVGDYALGQFFSDFAEVDFAKGSTFVAIQIFGSAAQGRKTALIAVARKVASEL